MTQDRQIKIIRKYIKLFKKNDGRVTLQDLKEIGITRDMVAHHFGSLSNLDNDARTKFPSSFSDVKIESLYSQKALDNLRNITTSKNRFVINTAVAGAKMNKKFYQSIKTFCKEKDAELLILVASDPAKNGLSNKCWGTIDSELANEIIVMEDTELNSNVFISSIKMSAKQIDPITGLGRISQRNGSCIFASPKQRLKAIAVGNHSYPKFMMGTGSITISDYNTDRYMSQRTAYIADNDHVVGALIVEIVDDKVFHFRQVQADKKGNFIDLGVQYCPNYTMQARPEAFVLGDLHSGETDEQAMSAWMEIIDLLKPKKVVLHDVFTGLSINHHEEHNIILRAQRAMAGELHLDSELILLAKDLEDIVKKVDEVVVVKSNHDLFLERYLREGRYVTDAFNHRLALELAIHLIDGNDPLAEGVYKYWCSEEKFSKITWLKLDQDYKVAGVQLASHGHIGSNGSSGTSSALESAYGNCIVGHSHVPEILRGLFRVGTSTKYKLSYNVGASSWMHSSCLLYSDGSRQLIHEIGGK